MSALKLNWVDQIIDLKVIRLPLGGLVCAGIALLIYATTIGHGFVLDDNLVITSNTHIQKGFGGIPDLLKYNYAHGHDGYNDGLYRPLSLVSFAIGKALHDLNPAILHFTQAMFYGLLILLLFLWLQALFINHKQAVFWIVLLFAVHPIHTEVVANIKSRDEIFALLFFCAAAWQFTLWLGSNNLQRLGLAVILMFLASFSKESAVTYIAIIPLIGLYIKAETKRIVLGSVAMGIPIVLFLIIRMFVLSSLGEVDSGVSNLLQNSLIEIGGIPERFATAAVIQGLYIQKLFIPINLSHDYSFNAIPVVGLNSALGLFWIGVNTILVAVGIWGLLKRKLWSFGVLLYYITVSVIANLFILIGAMAAERFLFTPSLGWCIAIVFLVMGFKSIEQYKTPLLAAVSIVFAIITLMRIPDWKSNLALFTTDVEVVSNSARAHYNAGTALNDHAKAKPREATESLAKAEAHLRRAIEIWPEYQDAYNNLGIAYMNSRQSEKAYDIYTTFIEKFPAYNKARYNMGMTCINLKKYTEAEKHLEVFLSGAPTNTQALLYTAEAEGYQGKISEARDHLLSLIAIEPNNVSACLKLGIAYGMLHDNTNALRFLKKAEQIAPKNPEVRVNLAVYYLSNGAPNEALSQLEACIKDNPNHPRANELLKAIQTQ